MLCRTGLGYLHAPRWPGAWHIAQRHFQRDAAQLGKGGPLLRVKYKRNQGGPRLDDLQAKLSRNSQSKIRGAQLRYGHTAGGENEAACLYAPTRRPQMETALLLRYRLNSARHAPHYARVIAFGAQHIDDELR